MATETGGGHGITDEDRVVVQGRYLVYEQDPSTRFRMRGMAFPVPFHEGMYNEEGWIAVMRQLREASPEINTLRVYRIPSIEGMDGFYRAAAELGFYLLVPLTSAQGNGVLDRSKDAPDCYTAKLFHYGNKMIESVKNHPNVLGGVLGNEVLNSLRDWPAAPCLLAYARDLKKAHPGFPLIYTTQHDGLTAMVKAADTAKLLIDYLTCHSNTTATIDILGINIESWCSSLQSFEHNEDGTPSSYLELHDRLKNSTIPLVFSELGCGQDLFNRDNKLGTMLGPHRRAREWQQISVVESEMADEFSGYIAYAYDGPPDFVMTTGGPWDGIHPLEFNLDMNNYIQALKNTSSMVPEPSIVQLFNNESPTCDSVAAFLQDCCDLELLDVEKIPSFSPSIWDLPVPFRGLSWSGRGGVSMALGILVAMILVFLLRRKWKRTKSWEESPVSSGTSKKSYDTFE